LIGHVGTVEDITERKKTEATLRRERDFIERIVEEAQAIVLVLDRQGRVVRFNPFLERITASPPDELHGADWFTAYVPERDRVRARAAFERALAGAQPCRVTHPIITRDQREREVEWAHRFLAGVLVDAPGVLAIGHDITELNEAQRRALQAERLAAIGQMMAGLAHESRNALQRIQACLEMLGRRLEGQLEVLDFVAGIQEAQDDLQRLHEEVRSYAAPIVLDLRLGSLRDMLHEAWDKLEPERRGRQASLREHGLADPICMVDRFHMVRVFRNILDNALQASIDPAEIDIEWAQARLDGQLAFRVVVGDHGTGLTGDQRSRLFEPFFTTKAHGTGLGMAIARRIVEAQGGRIEIGPERVEGTTILITLPRGRS
jgi:PAS domain S-box-containing protein